MLNGMIRYALVLLCALYSHQPLSALNEVLLLKHKDIEQSLAFNVQLPKGYSKNTDKTYNLLFDFHPMADKYLAGMHQWLSHNGEWPWPQTIIVTPKMGNPVGRLFDASGDSTPLMDFFEASLIPAIDAKYRTNGFRIFSGFRVNGTLVLSSLINKPNLFNAHIVTSPELNDDYAQILSKLPKALRNMGNKPQFLWVGHGNWNKEADNQEAFKQLHSMLQTQAPASLDWHFEVFEDNYFMSLPLLSLINAVERLFNDINNGLEPASPVSQKGAMALVEHFAYLSKYKYGFDVSPAASIRGLGEHQLTHSPGQALITFKTYAELYPDSAYSYHYLAQAYLANKDVNKALESQKQAVAMSQSMLSWHKKHIAKQMAKIEALAR